MEKAEYDETGKLNEENYHSIVPEIRQDTEQQEKVLRERLEKCRLDENPKDVGTSKRDTSHDESGPSNKSQKI
jgi:hypothetical protein